MASSSSSTRKRKGTLDAFVAAKKHQTSEPSGDTSSSQTSLETWKTNGTSLLYRWGAADRAIDKVACFDLDGTLVNTKGRLPFPQNVGDWVFFNEHVTPKLKALHDQGFRLVVFSNQGGIKSRLTGTLATRIKGRIDRILAEVALPMDVFLATMNDNFRKPETEMWNFFLKESKKETTDGETDMAASFFVGDAAGRSGDFSDSDKLPLAYVLPPLNRLPPSRIFASNVGLPFLTPEEIFAPPPSTVTSETPAAQEDITETTEC